MQAFDSETLKETRLTIFTAIWFDFLVQELYNQILNKDNA